MNKKLTNWWLGRGFSIPGFSSQYMWHKFDIATTNADPVTVSTDSLGNYNLGNFNTAPARGIQNSKECIEFLGTGGMRTGTTIGNTLFRSSFSVFFQAKLDDGQPAAAEFMFKDTGASGSRTSITVNALGTVQCIYSANSVIVSPTSAVIFANGATSDFVNFCMTVQSGGNLNFYTKVVGGSWTNHISTSIAAITMSAYDQGVGANNRLYVGSFDSATNYFNGFMRNFTIQPGIYSASDMEALSNL